MKALFSEAHAIVNKYRPHQARETLIHMMEEQVERCKAETRACKDACERVRGVLEQTEEGKGLIQPVLGAEEKSQSKVEKDRESKMKAEKRIWEVIEQEVGSFD